MESDVIQDGELYTKQCKIATNAMRLPNVSFTSLAYHIDEYWLFEAYEETSKEKACGVDGVTADEYKENLSTNLKNLLTKMKTGKYFAPPV